MMMTHRTLVSLLRERAQFSGSTIAFTFLRSDGSEHSTLTYAQLDWHARFIAAELQRRGLVPGARALLLFPPGLEFISAFFGCLYSGVIAVPAYPARSLRDLPRLWRIAQSAGAELAISTPVVARAVAALAAEHAELANLAWLECSLDALGAHEPGWIEPPLDRDGLAFLQFTSGSTGAPKGVMVSHGNLLHNQRRIQDAFQHDHTRSLVAGWLPVYHDMGLIGNVLQPIYLGRPCVLMSPLDFLQHPVLWLQAITRYRVTTSGGPNFAYDLCARRVTPAQRETLDLSSWDVAFNGAEPVRPETLARFSETFAACGFRREAFFPCYGLAEATLLVNGGPKLRSPAITSVSRAQLERRRVRAAESGTDARELVGCGRSSEEQRLLIVDPERRVECRPGELGEIWLASSSVCRGYWEQLEATEHTFDAYLADHADGPFLRTGDLGFIHAGELFVAGRFKDVIVIRGRNHYPEDIEWTVDHCNSALRRGCGAAFAVEADGEERLVIAQELTREALRGADLRAIELDMREAVAAHHGLRLHAVMLLRPGSIPKTSSGKIQRRACRSRYLEGELGRVTAAEAAP